MVSILIVFLSLFCLVASQVDNYYFYSVPLRDVGLTVVDHLYVQAVVNKKGSVYSGDVYIDG